MVVIVAHTTAISNPVSFDAEEHNKSARQERAEAFEAEGGEAPQYIRHTGCALLWSPQDLNGEPDHHANNILQRRLTQTRTRVTETSHPLIHLLYIFDDRVGDDTVSQTPITHLLVRQQPSSIGSGCR